MSNLYISEYAGLVSGVPGGVQAAQEPSIATQKVSFTTATQSSAFNTATRFIRVHSDAVCSISFGTNPTATTSHLRLVAGQTEYFGVVGGHKVSAVDNT